MARVLPNYFHLMESKFSSSILSEFKDLIENKHLYQSVSIKFPSFEEAYKDVVTRIPPSITGKKSDSLKECQYIYDSAPDFGWQIHSPRATNYSALGGYGGPPVRRVVEIEFTPSTIKIFCPICDRIEPHNFYHGVDFSQSLKDTNNKLLANSQIFLLAYECQSCKNPPTVFVVRREKNEVNIKWAHPNGTSSSGKNYSERSKEILF